MEAAACFEFLSDLRAARPMPILTTHTSAEVERTYAYDTGADLCMDAPVHVTELAAGIRAMLRRHYTLNRMAWLREAGITLRHRELAVDPQHRTVTMRGALVGLLAKKFDILYFLVRYPGNVFTRDASITTTQIYTHKNTDIERAAITSFTNVLNFESLANAPRLNGASKQMKFADVKLPHLG